mmetsp:Transcript_21572/g.40410  ORF Transcript_21572/g.40410 Transcript_21572/m.40410 type:complete len:89 (-) Transcript_21572:807-1073(-)
MSIDSAAAGNCSYMMQEAPLEVVVSPEGGESHTATRVALASHQEAEGALETSAMLIQATGFGAVAAPVGQERIRARAARSDVGPWQAW